MIERIIGFSDRSRSGSNTEQILHWKDIHRGRLFHSTALFQILVNQAATDTTCDFPIGSSLNLVSWIDFRFLTDASALRFDDLLTAIATATTVITVATAAAIAAADASTVTTALALILSIVFGFFHFVN